MTLQEDAAAKILDTALLAVERELRRIGGRIITPPMEPHEGEALPVPLCDLLSMLTPLLRALSDERYWWGTTKAEMGLARIGVLLGMVEAFNRYHFSVGDEDGALSTTLRQANRAIHEMQAVFAPVAGSA